MNRPTSVLTRAWRLSRMGLHIGRGCATLATVFPKATPVHRNQMVRAWGRHVLRIFALELTVVMPDGFDPHAPRRLLIGNHISWIDIYVLQAITAARFVAKSEVAAWPILGKLAAGSGTVFIERGKRFDTRRINRMVQDRLETGEVIGVFPEGTTTHGRDVRKFHGGLLQAALDCGAEIVPFCLRYTDADGCYTAAPAYIDDLSFWDSIKLMLREKRLHCELTFFSPLVPDGRDRRALAAAAENMVREQLRRHASQD